MSSVPECKMCGATVRYGPCLCATCAQHLEEDRDWWKAAYATDWMAWFDGKWNRDQLERNREPEEPEQGV